MEKKMWVGMLILVQLMILLTGCAGKTGKDYQQEDVYCTIEETAIADPEQALREMAGNRNVQGEEFLLYRNGICRFVAVLSENQSDLPECYLQDYSFSDSKWVFYRIQDICGEEDAGYRLGLPIPNAKDESAVSIFSNEEDYAWMTTLVDRVQKVNQPNVYPMLSEVGTDKETKTFVDYAETGYLYHNRGFLVQSDRICDLTVYHNDFQQAERREVPGWILGMVQKDDASPVYWYGIDEDGNATVQDLDGNKIATEKSSEITGGELVAGYDGETLCLADRRGLWAVRGKKIQKICNFMEQGYSIKECYGMARDGDDHLQMVVKVDGELLRLQIKVSDQPIAQEKEEIVLAMTLESRPLNAVIAKFNRRNATHKIRVVCANDAEDWSDFRSRIQMELGSGKGPDLLGSDVLMDAEGCARNGYLCEMSVDEFDYDGLLDSVVQDCSVGESIFGIPYDFQLQFAAYREEDVPGKDRLSLNEMMDMVRKSGAKLLQKDLSGVRLVWRFGLWDESNKAFIDWEKGISHLNEAPFMELLEFAEEYGDNSRAGNDEVSPRDIFSTGPFGILQSFYDIKEFDDDLGGEVRMLGYPRTEGNGIYVQTRRIYVNSQSPNREQAKEFLRFLISEEGQMTYTSYDIFDDLASLETGTILAGNGAAFSVNRTVLEEQKRREWERDKKNFASAAIGGASGLYAPYTEKQFEEIDFLLEHTRVENHLLAGIEDIVTEELTPYFEGTKSASQVCETLHRRVQLYLDEKK